MFDIVIIVSSEYWWEFYDPLPGLITGFQRPEYLRHNRRCGSKSWKSERENRSSDTLVYDGTDQAGDVTRMG